MEDLGNININIREFGATGGGGGGGGSGQPGGGPRVTPKIPAAPASGGSATPSAAPPMPPINPAAVPSSIPRISQIAQKISSGLQLGGAAKSELSGFISSPSLSGLGQLASAESATSQALAALGVSATAAAAILLPLGVVVGAVVVGLKALQYAASETAQRIAEVAKYSGVLMNAVGLEKYNAIQRSLQDAAENGNAYASAQRAATQAANSQASVQRDLNAVLALGAVAWHKIVLQFNNFLKPYTAIAAFFARLVPTSNAQGQPTTAGKMLDEAGNWLMRIFVPFYGMMELFNTITEYLRKLLVFCGIIADNTKTQTKTIGVNDWFISDMQVMSQSKYDRKSTSLHQYNVAKPQLVR